MTLPKNPTFDFALSGVSGDVTFGKGGPSIASVNGELQFFDANGLPGNITVNQGNFTAIGVGTSTISYPADIWGNIHIGNTATTSGIIFPDGTFQGTAAFYTPPGGSNGAVQFNEGNLFAANALFTFDNANIRLGIGTAVPLSTLDLRGNLQISNTATGTHGIIFPDGSFQDSASQYTPSFGYPGTVQFAGNANTFSGDSSHLVWDSGNTQLIASNLYINSNIASAGPSSGALRVLGGVGVIGDINVLGNITGSSNTVIIGNSGVFFGDTYGFGALYGGIKTGYVYQPNTVLQLSANVNDYAQLNLQNINPGSAASGDMVITADNGSNNDTYIDLGINSSTFDQGTIDAANDGYLYVSGNAVTGGGNLVLGTLAANDIVFAQGGADPSNEVARFLYGQGLAIELTTASTDPRTGALTVAGGVGISGDVNTAGAMHVAGAAIAGSLTSNTTIQSAGNAYFFDIYSNTNVHATGTIVGNAVNSNTFVHALGEVTGGTVKSNSSIQAATLINGQNIVSNATITAGTSLLAGTITSNSTIQAAGAVTAATVNSNGAVVGGSLTSNSTIQAAGVATVNSLISNTNIYGASLNTAGVAQVNSLISNNNVFGATVQSSGQTLVDSLTVNNASTTNTLNVRSAAVVATLSSNTAVSAQGLISGANIHSNGFIEGATLKTTGLAVVNQLISNTEATANTLNIITNAVVQTLTSNTGIQAGTSVLANTINSNLSITSPAINALNNLSSNTITSNVTLNAATVNASGVVRITNTAVSGSTGSGALIVTGGVGIGGNLNVGGVQSLFAGNLVVSGNFIVRGNSTIVNSNTINVTGPTIQVGSDNTEGNVLTYNDGYDRGIVMNYFILNDNNAFMGFQNSTGRFVYITNVQPGVSNLFNPFESVPGYVYGTAQFGTMYLSNSTISINSSTGALVVSGGVGIGGNVNALGQIATTGQGRFGQDLLANQLNSNTAISAVSTITGSSIHANNEVSSTNISASNSINGFLIAANSSVTSTNITALQSITGNLLVGNLAVVTPNVQATTLVTAQNIIANSSIVTTSLTAGGLATVNALISNTNTTTATLNSTGTAQVNSLISNTNTTTATLNSTGAAQVNSLISNTNTTTATLNSTGVAQVNELQSNLGVYSNYLQVRNFALVDSLQSNTTIQAGLGLLANYISSNTAVWAASLIQTPATIQGDDIYANTYVQSPSVYANLRIQSQQDVIGNRIIGNALVQGSIVQGTAVVNGGLITSNSNITASGSVIADSVYGNSLVQTAGTVSGNFVSANAAISSQGPLFAQSIYSNSTIQASNTAVFNTLYSNSLIQTPNTIQGSQIYSNTLIQTIGPVVANQLTANNTIQAASIATVGSLYSNNFIQASGIATVNALVVNTSTQTQSLVVQQLATVQNLSVNANITASNLTVSYFTRFNVAVIDTSVTAGTYMQANQFYANVNVGIGTASINYPLDVYGNIHIGNTATTTSGIIFPDGTFQDTAPIFTPSFGYQNTIQFAGNANTFSGDSSNLVWDNVNLALNTSNLVVINNANIGANANIGMNATIGNNINLAGNLNGSNTTVMQGKTAILQGGAGGFGALYAGVQDYTNYQPNTVALFAGNANATVQIGVHNDSAGGLASSDIVITANNGSANDTYINMGINSSGWNQNTADGPNDGYVVVHGNLTTGGGNLVLGTILPNDILFTQNGVNAANVAARLVYGQGLVVYGSANSTSTSTGSLVAGGGLGVGGNAYIGGALSVVNSAVFNSNISVSTDGAFGGNVSLLGNLTVAQSSNIAVDLVVGNSITAYSGSIGSLDSINSRGFANVQVLQSNGHVSGNTWVVDGNAYTSTSSFQQVVDSWSTSSFRTAWYMLQVTNTVTSSYQASQIMLIQDGTDVWLTEYADINTNGVLGLWEADIVSGTIELLFTPVSSQNMAIKVVRTTIDL